MKSSNKKKIVRPEKEKNNKTNKPLKLGFNLVLLILILTVLFFGRIRKHDLTNWDDPIMVTNNAQIRSISFEGVMNIFTPSKEMNEYQPLTTLSYAISYHFFRLNPASYLLSNLFFHLLNIVLVFYLIFLLSKNHLLSFFVSFLFALHPLQVEVVAWVSAHNYVLFGLFFLLSIISYIKYIQNDLRRKYLIYALLFFVFALFSKASAVILPLSLLCFDYYYKREIRTRLLLEKLPFFALSFIFGIIALIPKTIGHFASMSDQYGFIDRMFFGFYSMSFYFIKLLFPLNLKVLYMYPVKAGAFLPLLFYLAPLFILLLFFLIKYNKIEKRTIIFGVFFLLSNVILILHFIPYWHRAIVTDRYVYIGSIGMFLIIGVFIQYFLKKYAAMKYLIYFITFFYFGFLLFNTNKRIDVWESNMTLWSEEIRINPKNAVAYNNRGLERSHSGDYHGAIEDFNKAIELKPKDLGIYYNRASAKTAIGDFAGAIADYDVPIAISPNNAEAFNKRGLAKYNFGDFEGAVMDFKKALEILPESEIFYNNLGLAEFELGNYDAAINDYRMAIRINPNYEKAYYNKGNVYDKINNVPRAIVNYSKAIEINPAYADAYNNRGLMYNKLKEHDNALSDFDKAVSYNSNLYSAFNNRGKVHVEMQNYSEAINDFKKAIEINSEFASAYLNKGIAYFYLNNILKACTNWQEANKYGDSYAKELLENYCK
ncbi:MAG: tetratricopeptide repeat protein [Bacteroidales bacterium]|nr:tetratricopeptide repeat protein [Bacteroidales bacterium]